MSGIELDPEKGVNPFLTYCPRCKNEGPELMLIGRRQYYETCVECGIASIGGRPRGGKCPKCERNNGWVRHAIKDGERLPSSDVCDNCKEQIEQVKQGGVFFECEDCSAIGAVKADAPFAAMVRQAHKLTEPGDDGVYPACGVQFTKEECPACGPDAEAHMAAQKGSGE
jgi:hypothetical protein